TARQLLDGLPLALHGLIEYNLKGPERDKNPDRALELVEEALRIDPNHVPSINQKADILVEKGQLEAAENLYRIASRKRPGYGQCYTRLIDLYGKDDWFDKKQGELEPLLHIVAVLDPRTNFLNRTDLGAMYQLQGERYWPKAEQLHREAIEAYPAGIMALLNLGYFYLDQQQQFEKAATVFQQAIQKAPEAREGYLAMARLHEAQENWADAIEQHRQVLRIMPSWERFELVGIGRCLRQLQRLDEAEKAFLHAWKLDLFDDSGALGELYAMAENLYKAPGQPQTEQAVLLLERIAQTRSAEPDYAAGMANRQGHAYFYVGRYAEALPYYEKAAGIQPNEPVYYSNQFDCLEKIYRQNPTPEAYEKALQALQQVADQAPHDSSIPKKRRALALIRHNPHLAELPVLYQVHVEVGHPLVDEITKDFATLLPGMLELTDALRARLQKRFGISLPGLRYRDISEGEGIFQFRLYETPVWYDQLSEKPPTMSAVLDQLERFVTHYGLDLFVNYWDVDREVPLLPNAELVHFTRVVMALLSEQTPLPALPALHALYRSIDGLRLPVAGAVERLRLLEPLRSQLPGVQETFRYLPLDEQEERKLAACLIGQGDSRALALPLGYARRLLGAVARSAQEHDGLALALVTRQENLRPHLRTVLAGLPQLAVLKENELPPQASERLLEPLVAAEADDALFQQLAQPIQSFVLPGKPPAAR
ncbi:MAG: tetratricopeptide repeat protein, partial [Saprospiraceae bacterium]|nr:tetratricopeptide repeat protein [Saprospiraceae bacterium]